MEDLTPQLVAAVAHRTAHLTGALAALGDDALLAPSELPDWSRLTIACHLRYGAQALHRMTAGTLYGERVSYYPGGRVEQRPSTLQPAHGESPQDVVSSLARHSDALHAQWAALEGNAWELQVTEPESNHDLGTVVLGRLLLLRLTEVEVHGGDLALGLDDWSELFVREVLPMRLAWLNIRRANHRPFDAQLVGTWLLIATDGPTYAVTARGDAVESRPAAAGTSAQATVEGSSRDLLALLLGRPVHQELRLSGDTEFARAFSRAFPGP